MSSPDLNGQQIAKQVEFADIGCGYGGLLMDLAPMYKDTLMLGMEIRDQVAEFVDKKIKALRINAAAAEDSTAHDYQNISVIRANAMKFLPNFFKRGQLTKMFFLFADPHFKKKKHKARIITQQLLAEYAYIMRIGGILYTVTDVKDLHEWECKYLDAFPLFERLTEDELALDPVCAVCMKSTEEGKKVERNNGDKYIAVYRRIADPIEMAYVQ